MALDEESYTCDICHKHFSTYEKLEDHELLHEDVKLSALDTQNQDQVGFFVRNILSVVKFLFMAKLIENKNNKISNFSF